MSSGGTPAIPITSAPQAAAPQTAAPAVVRVLLFAGLREQAGWSSREVALTGTTLTPLTVWGRLRLGAGGPASPSEATTAAAPQPPGILVAINHQFASWEAPLRGGDELAFLPPITGG